LENNNSNNNISINQNNDNNPNNQLNDIEPIILENTLTLKPTSYAKIPKTV